MDPNHNSENASPTRSKTVVNEVEPSFTDTFKSVEEVIATKTAKFKAYKALMEAEAKLSLSSVLLSAAISLLLVVVLTIVWLFLNLAVGLAIYSFTQSIAVSLSVPTLANICLGLWLFSQLRKVWKLVGIPSSLKVLEE